MYVSSERTTQSRHKPFIVDIATAIAIALLALVLIGPFLAHPARADQIRHAECPSSTTLGATASMPYIESGNVTEWIETLNHNDDCPH